MEQVDAVVRFDEFERSAESGPELPGDFCCTGCGYMSGVSGSVVCPECGRRATDGEVAAYWRRQAEVEAWEGGDKEAAVQRWVRVTLVYGLGAVLVGRIPIALVLTPVMLGGPVAVSWLSGRVVAKLKREDLRAHTRVVWERELWRLHLPWLVAPVFVVVALLVGMIDVWAGAEGGGVYWLVVMSGVVMWAGGCLWAYWWWWSRYFGRGVAKAGGPTRIGASEAAAFGLGLVIVCGASGIGFGAGTVAANGVAEWLGLGELFAFNEEF